MIAAVNLDTCEIVQGVSARSALARFVLLARTQRRVSFRFFRTDSLGGCELPGDATGQLILKHIGQPMGPALARAVAWEQEGVGADAVYHFHLDLRTVEMSSLFPGQTESREDLALELSYRAWGHDLAAPRVPCTVWNRYLQDDEGIPSPADPPYPQPSEILTRTDADGRYTRPGVAAPMMTLTAPDGGVWEVTVTNDGQLERRKL